MPTKPYIPLLALKGANIALNTELSSLELDKKMHEGDKTALRSITQQQLLIHDDMAITRDVLTETLKYPYFGAMRFVTRYIPHSLGRTLLEQHDPGAPEQYLHMERAQEQEFEDRLNIIAEKNPSAKVNIVNLSPRLGWKMDRMVTEFQNFKLKNISYTVADNSRLLTIREEILGKKRFKDKNINPKDTQHIGINLRDPHSVERLISRLDPYADETIVFGQITYMNQKACDRLLMRFSDVQNTTLILHGMGDNINPLYYNQGEYAQYDCRIPDDKKARDIWAKNLNVIVMDHRMPSKWLKSSAAIDDTTPHVERQVILQGHKHKMY